ncbi:hypothetical protein [Natronorubrum halophilum]|uniref:hypothetical protein n=1 Tax=Natronorubrum halophilum TaxID=1702106 RepID=UPI001EE8EE13|nr:hypothetical protein [Natronorubrum halophilum]
MTEAVLDAVSADEGEIDVFAIRKADLSADDLTSEHEWRFEPERDALPIGTEAFLLGPDAGGIGPEPDEREPPVLEGSH